MYTRDSRELNEIKYLKKISGISSLTLKGTDFIELEEQNGVDNLYSFYTKKFKPNDLSLLKLSSKVSILEKITELFYKKIDSLKDSKSKEYYFLTKFSFGSLVKNNHIASQKIISRYNTVPLYIIPTLVKLSFDTKNILQDDSLIVWKDKIKKNQPIIEFIIADKPFIPQELFDYQISEESEHIGKGDFYLPLFDINETNLEQIFSLMALHLNHVVTEKKEILHNNNYLN